jgi:hypothetical protein
MEAKLHFVFILSELKEQTVLHHQHAASTGTFRLDDVSLFGTVSSTSSNPSVNLSVSSNAASEAAATVITVTATASQIVTGDQTINLDVSGTNITAGDYTLNNSVITILDGQTTVQQHLL